jgi:hypothetical protein
MAGLRVVVCPGNGCVPVAESNWYEQARQALQETGIFTEVCMCVDVCGRVWTCVDVCARV